MTARTRQSSTWTSIVRRPILGDFERTFGAGADAVSIIDGLSQRDDGFRRAKASEIYCETFESALALAKSSPGNSMRREESGNRFVVDFGERRFAIEVPLPDGFIEPVWVAPKAPRWKVNRSPPVTKAGSGTVPSFAAAFSGHARDASEEPTGAEDRLIKAKDDPVDVLASVAVMALGGSCRYYGWLQVPPPPLAWMQDSLAQQRMAFKPLTKRITLVVHDDGSDCLEGILVTDPGETFIVASAVEGWLEAMLQKNKRGEYVR